MKMSSTTRRDRTQSQNTKATYRPSCTNDTGRVDVISNEGEASDARGDIDCNLAIADGFRRLGSEEERGGGERELHGSVLG
jgi:hypothetical protein